MSYATANYIQLGAPSFNSQEEDLENFYCLLCGQNAVFENSPAYRSTYKMCKHTRP